MVQEVSDNDFDAEVLQSDKPVLVDFWAEWCGPCKALAPTIDELANEYEGKMKFTKINIDENPDAPQKYGVRSIPTIMIFKDGQVEATKIGNMPKDQLKSAIELAL